MCVNYDSLFLDMKNILERAGFDGIQAVNEIINILLFKFGERNTKEKYHVNNIYKKYCKQYDKTKEKNSQIAQLYHFVYGNSDDTVINKFTEQCGIHIHTYMTIEHKYDLAELYILMYYTFNKKKFILDVRLRHNVVKYLYKHDRTLFTDNHIIELMIKELAPMYTDICFDGNCMTGEFLVELSKYISEHYEEKRDILQKNLYGFTRTNNFYKLTIFNMLTNNVNIENINKINENVDIIIGKYNYIDVGLIDNLKNGGKGALLIPCSILYNNYVNKNSPSLSKTLSLTWEYKLRKMLLEQTNLYKIVLFPNNEAVIFFVKGYNTKVVMFEMYESKKNITVDIQCIQDNDYCLMPYTYCDTSNKINRVNITYSKVVKCNINKKEHNILNYRNILLHIYKIIGKRELIKKNTLANIEYGKISIRGYRYIEDLDMSLQGIDAYQTFCEIKNQCKANKIKLELIIRLDNGSKVNFVI